MMGLHAKGDGGAVNGDDWSDGSDDVADDGGDDIQPSTLAEFFRFVLLFLCKIGRLLPIFYFKI